MKVVLVFVFLSLLGASLASLTVKEQIEECDAKFPIREFGSDEDGGPTDITKQGCLCLSKAIGLYADGKFSVNGLVEEVRSKMTPGDILRLQSIIARTKGRDDGETAALIAKALLARQ